MVAVHISQVCSLYQQSEAFPILRNAASRSAASKNSLHMEM